ncbi:MAG: hypothetical protein NUW00_01165, partial [Candidatus Kaiserbacteria bacterium]|nr:hypothetical protein [Candidatus Kaiserbacteria bacterium]
IGFWVDPEPTPGGENEVSIEDLRSAGFDEATIAMLLDLAALMDTKVSEPLPVTSRETENVSEGTQEKQTMSEDTGNTESDTSLESETLVDEMQSDAPLTEETKNDVSIEDPIEQVVAIREDEMLPPNPDPVTSSEEIISSDTEVTETIENVLLDESGVENDEIVSDDQPAVIEKVLEEPTPINKEDQVSPDVIPDVEPDAN